MPWEAQYKAYAKVNLFLNILGQRPDGFHALRTIFQTVSLHDTLTISSQGPGSSINLSCSQPELANSDNIVVLTYHHFYQHLACEPVSLNVYLEKRIPLQAGLGGGSADAAALLRALWQFHEEPCSLETLCTIAASLGADVPFFLLGGTCLAEGHGDMLYPQANLPAYAVALIKPKKINIPTPQAYQWIREAKNYQTKPLDVWEGKLAKPNSPIAWKNLLYNDFESPVFERFVELKNLHQALTKAGIPSLLSGSGSTVFAILTQPEEEWKHIQSLCPALDWWLSLSAFEPAQCYTS